MTPPLFTEVTVSCKPWKWAVMYMCVRGMTFASVCDISIGFWNCSDSVVFIFDFHYICIIYCKFSNILKRYVQKYFYPFNISQFFFNIVAEIYSIKLCVAFCKIMRNWNYIQDCTFWQIAMYMYIYIKDAVKQSVQIWDNKITDLKCISFQLIQINLKTSRETFNWMK